jgi:hypothetical protein
MHGKIITRKASEDNMIQYTFRHHVRSLITVAVIATGVIVAGPEIADSHCGKTHGEEPFSAFQAVQKATQLYDRLILSGKLPEDWETSLSSIHVSVRGAEKDREYVVQFKRSDGDPDSVYSFFDRQGEYSGSNFSGE